MGRILDSVALEAVDLTLDAHLGSATLTVAELNAMSADTIIPLETTLDAAVQLHLNGVAIAEGELVAVGDKFAVRLTRIAS